MKKYRFLILRRLVQIGTLFLFALGNYAGVKVLEGNLSAARLLGSLNIADPFGFLQAVLAGSAIAAEFAIGALIVLAFYAIVGGRVFCSFVCPINLIADLAALTRRLTGVNSLSQPVNLPRSTRYYAAVLALILSFVLGVAVFDAISPIGLFTRALYFGALLGFCGAAAIFLWDLFVQRNGWCGHICPLGAFYSLVGKFSPLKIIFKRSLCTDCYECKKICPEQQVLSAVSKDNSDAAIVISAIECMKCGRCVEVCEGGALGFALTLKTKESK